MTRQHRIAPIVFGAVLSLGAIALAYAMGGDGFEAARNAARWTARMSFCLFLPVYAASSLVRLWPGPRTKALLRDRRYWGLGFAVAHFVHLGALTHYLLASGQPPKTITLVGGGGGYFILLAMVLTSSDAAMRALGVWWKRLHVLGIHWLWIVFANSYVGRIFDSTRMTTGLVFAPLAFAALALRIAAWAKARRRRTVSGSAS